MRELLLADGIPIALEAAAAVVSGMHGWSTHRPATKLITAELVEFVKLEIFSLVSELEERIKTGRRGVWEELYSARQHSGGSCCCGGESAEVGENMGVWS